MRSSVRRILATEVARVLPFAVYLAIPALGGAWLPQHEYWLYLVKVMIVAGLVIWLRPRLPEMRWAFSWAAVGVGLAIAILWELASNYVPGLGRLFDHAQHLLLGKPLPPIHEPERWTPLVAFSHSPGLAYFFVAARVLGRSFLVPLVEEVFLQFSLL